MKKTRMHCMSIMAIIVLSLCFGVTPSAAESSPADNWEFGAEVYMWGANIGGEASDGSNIKIDFKDLFNNLEMAFMGTFLVRKGKWSLMTDAIYMDVEDAEKISGEHVQVELTAKILTPVVGYTFLETKRGALSLLGGARYLYLDGNLRVEQYRTDDSGHVWDGIIGIRGKLNLSETWYLSGHLDIGTGDSDMTWQALAGIGYRFKRFDIVAGYRYLKWNFDNNDVFKDLILKGPMGGVKVIF